MFYNATQQWAWVVVIKPARLAVVAKLNNAFNKICRVLLGVDRFGINVPKKRPAKFDWRNLLFVAFAILFLCIHGVIIAYFLKFPNFTPALRGCKIEDPEDLRGV